MLANHCDTYDRPVDDVDVSWFTRCIIRETPSEVERILDEAPRYRDPDPEDPLSSYNNLIGTPEEVIEQLEPYRELGIDEVDIEFVDFPDTTGLELFADRVAPAFR